jgi:hypothetical protein
LVQRGLRHAASDRNHPIEKMVLRSVGLTQQPTDSQIDEITAAIGTALSPLLAVAMSGNIHAIRKVTELASTLCAETTTLTCMHQAAADTVARERTTWPLNLSHDAKERRRTLRLVTGSRRLPLGNPPQPAAASPSSSGFSHPATAAVLVAIKAIEIERSFRIPSELFPSLQPAWSAEAAALPELTPSSAPAWFRVIWQYICDRHAGAPERSELRRLLAATETQSDAAARAALRQTLEAAFHQLARTRSKTRPRRR